jgi:hypothetical protein
MTTTMAQIAVKRAGGKRWYRTVRASHQKWDVVCAGTVVE